MPKLSGYRSTNDEVGSTVVMEVVEDTMVAAEVAVAGITVSRTMMAISNVMVVTSNAMDAKVVINSVMAAFNNETVDSNSAMVAISSAVDTAVAVDTEAVVADEVVEEEATEILKAPANPEEDTTPEGIGLVIIVSLVYNFSF